MRTPAELVEDRRAAVAVGRVGVREPELLEDARRGRRQERRGGQRDQAARFEQIAQDLRQPPGRSLVAALRGLRDRPRLFAVHVAVRVADEPQSAASASWSRKASSFARYTSSVFVQKPASGLPEKLDGARVMSLAEMLDIVEDKMAFERILQTLDVPAFSIRNPTCVGGFSGARRSPWRTTGFCASTPISRSR